jgi:O-antigen/teichoic acid export membrane protein
VLEIIEEVIDLKKEMRLVIDKIIKFSIPSIISFAINILSAIIVTRHFIPSDYGLINTFNATTTFIMAIACLGLDSGFIRYFFDLPSGFDKKTLFLSSLIIPIIALLFFSLIIFIIPNNFSNLLFGVNNKFLLILLSINVFSTIVIRFLTILYRMDGNTLMYSLLIVSSQVSLKGALIFAAFIKPNLFFSINSIVISTLFMVFIFIIYNYKYLKPKNINFTKKLHNLIDFFKYSIYSWPIPTLLYFNILTTLLIIRLKLGSEAVGIFSSVSVFVGLIGVLQTGFTTFWSGFMYENYQKKQTQIKKINEYVTFLTIILLIGFILFKDIMYLLIGKNYHDTKPYFAIILINPIMLILSETTSYGISIAKKSRLLLIITLLTVFINLGLAWILIPNLGILGAAIASAMSGVFFFLTQTFYGLKYYSSVENVNKVLLAVCLILILAFSNLFYYNSFSLISVICLLVLFISIFLFKSIFNNILNQILTKNQY